MSNEKKGGNRKVRTIISLGFAVIVFLFSMYWSLSNPKTDFTYGELIKLIENNQVESIVTMIDYDYATVVLKGSEEVKKAVIPSLEEFTSFISSEIAYGGIDIDFKVLPDGNKPFKTVLDMLPLCFFAYAVSMPWQREK